MNTSDPVRQRLNPETSISGLTMAFTALDGNRAVGYGALGRARAAKSASLAREQKLLAVKHGSASHPRIAQAAAALPVNELFRRDLASSQEVLETPAPEVDANSFLVYGFVRRRNQTGIPGLTLALTDAQGVWLKTAGYACTDRRGYFELRIQRSAGEKDTVPAGSTPPEAETKSEAAARAEAERKAAAERAQAVAAGGSASIKTNVQTPDSDAKARAEASARERASVQLRVFDRAGRVLHVEARPVVPAAGAMDYRLIILDDDDCGCTPPPEKSEGKPAPSGPRAPVAPPAAPKEPSAGPVAPRVANLKSYQSPPDPASSGQPLEAIRGIGPKTASKLRAAGIDDVGEFKQIEGAALVKLAGFDKIPPKVATAKPVPEKTAPKPTAAVAGTAETKAVARKAEPTKSAKKTTTARTAAAKTKKKPK